MTAYYNEHDEFAADWLHNLIKAGLIADGEVDTRSIADVRPGDLAGFTQCHFFAGIGGWSYALRKAGWDDNRPAWTGSCPCQPFSLAGAQKGFDDSRHLWPDFITLIAKCMPPVVFGEQVASATEWLGLVRGDLEALGYAVGCLPIQAASAGSDHLRDRYWFVADSESERFHWRQDTSGAPGRSRIEANGLAYADSMCRKVDQNTRGSENGSGAGPITGFSGSCDGDVAYAISERGCGRDDQRQDAAHADASGETSWVVCFDGKRRPVKPGIRLLAHGIPNRVGLLRGFGNAIDPRPAAAFIEAFMSAHSDRGSAQT